MSKRGPVSYLNIVSSSQVDTDSRDSRVAGFPEDQVAPFLRACRKLDDAGYGKQVSFAYRSAARACAKLVGASAAIDLADTVSVVTIKCGRDCAQSFCNAAPTTATLAKSSQLFLSWINLIQRMATLAPESVPLVLARNETILSEVGVSGLESWVLSGLRSAGSDRERRKAFFSLDDPEAVRLLQQEAGETVFSVIAGCMKGYMTALFGVSVPFVEAAAHLPPERRRRSSFNAGYLQLPATYPGYRGQQAEDVFRAAVAHAGAHYRFSSQRFPLGELRPVQVAVVSLIEDARVEALAIREFPGLMRLWLPFHIAQSSGSLTAPSLFARLSRALIDPDFSEIDGWVRKGRDLFNAHRDQLDDPAISRHIGNLLGNDLGQMRVQFNAKTYVVEPPYRDDNAGLWDFGADSQASDIELAADTYRLNTVEDDRPDSKTHEGQPEDAVGRAAPLDEAAAEPFRHLANYPEYDYALSRERQDWTRVFEYELTIGDPSLADQVLVRRQDDANRIASLVRAMRVSRARRLKRQAEGDALDLDACIEAAINLRMGGLPDPSVYQLMQRRDRDLAVHLLLDASQSTADLVSDSSASVFDIEREATVMLSAAMSEMNDPFAVSAFATNGREDVRIYPVKPFDSPFDDQAKSRLFGLKPGLSTRLGTVLRHGAHELERTVSYRRLLMVVTDGEPSDIDCVDKRYLAEDARRAVQSISSKGINVFCIALGNADETALEHIFGRQNTLKITKISQLPQRLPLIYLRLAR
ncbi:MAG: VWA domain-containing protein [Pseudomonadota bacterium]